MNRLKRLAKLRQYRSGDIAEYLRTEHRQNLLALEDALRIEDAAPSSTEITIESGALLFSAHISGTFTGIINLSAIPSATIFGTIIGNDYQLPAAGVYLIKYGYHLNFSNISGVAGSTLSLINQSVPTTLQTIAVSIPIAGNNVVQPAGANGYLLTITAPTLVRFSVSNSNCTPNRFHTEIYKVG
jgi:hypothetical protein